MRLPRPKTWEYVADTGDGSGRIYDDTASGRSFFVPLVRRFNSDYIDYVPDFERAVDYEDWEATQRQRDLLMRRYGTYTPKHIRDYFLPEAH